MNSPKVIIVILNWNNAPDTLACLDSLKNNVAGGEVLIIDNGSADGSGELIRQWIQKENLGGQMEVIPLLQNKGFAGGNNEGIKEALKREAAYVLLLNNDTLVPSDALKRLFDSAAGLESLGVLGCKIRDFSDEEILFNGGYFDLLRGAVYHEMTDSPGIKDTGFVTGCLMLIPTDVLKKVGTFDERFFLNAEDWDLCWRIKKLGYRLMVNSDVTIRHKGGSSQGGRYSALYQYYFHRNRMLFFEKNLSLPAKMFFFSFQFLLAIPLWMIWQIAFGRLSVVKAAFLGYRDYSLRKFGACCHQVKP
jgi:GT2 family glycosyltransferase